MIDQEQVRVYVDEYAALARESSRIKERMDWLKGYFEILAAEELKDTKLLTAAYWGSQNSRVTVTNAATVKPVSLTMVKEVLGKVAGLLARRCFNIDSLTVGETDDPEISCMTIVSSGDARTIEQIEK